MSRLLLVANWKMHKTVEESLAWGRAALRRLEERGPFRRVDLVVCPTLPALWALARLFGPDGPVALGAQNLDPGREGAVTGAVSGYLVAGAGARYVIVGHSERRAGFGETDAVVAAKTRAALEAGLIPIVCVGETAEERAQGATEAVVGRQADAVLAAVPTPPPAFVFAYEPVWAIGSGRVPTVEEADAVAALLVARGRRAWGEGSAPVRVLYGGSVNPGNVAAFAAAPAVDGALVGGASLDVEQFLAMADALDGLQAKGDGDRG